MHMSYGRFAAMIATSTVAMFGLMYLNTYALEHVLWSETRLWMAFVMGATMAVIMLSYMLNMYPNKAVNTGIFAGSVIVFATALWLVRSQTTINQVEYMQAMVPHHSIAVMTSERAHISDPRARKLADEIIEAQRREIAEMKYLIADLEANEASGSVTEKPTAQVVPPAQAISSPDLTTTDLGTMEESDLSKALPPDQGCTFAYTEAGKPVFAVSPSPSADPAQALVKIHGRLVELRAEQVAGFEALTQGGSFAADGIRIEVTPLPDEEPSVENGKRRWPADLRLQLEQELEVGYRGWYSCRE